jgi:Cd(II)/Pb(II)-responsive transcriptional regulator
MNIGELARSALCSVETVRYYEKAGLLPEPERMANGYRTYQTEHRQRLVFIRNCRTLDMSQEEIHSLLDLMDKGTGEDCVSVNSLLDEHIRHVELRIAELRRLKAQLSTLRSRCRSRSTVGDCRILQGLSAMRGTKKIARTHL